MAQAEDLADRENQRQTLYLSRANIDALRANREAEQALERQFEPLGGVRRELAV